MTTDDTPRHTAARARLAASAAAGWLAVTLGVLVLAGLLDGASAVAGAAVGAVTVLAFFGLGALVLLAVTRVLPSAALLVALLTYALQVGLLALLFVGLRSAGLLGTELDARWLAIALVAGTLAWTVAHVLLAVTTPLRPLPPPSPRDPGATAPKRPLTREAGASW